MIPYGILLITVCFLCYLNQKKSSKTIRKLIFFILGVFSGIRYYVSVDYGNYCDVFYAIKYGGYYSIEKSFVLISRIVQHFGGTPQIIFLFYSLLFSYFVFQFIEKESTDFTFSVIIFLCFAPFYLSSFNTIREFLSVSILLYSLTIDESKKAKIFVLVLIAICIHTSAIIGVALWILKKIKIKHEIIFVLFFSALMYAFLSIYGFNYLSQSLSGFRESSYSVSALGISYLIFLLFGLFVLYLSYRGIIPITQIEKSLIIYSCIIILVALLSRKYETLFARFITYGSFYFVISYPKLQRLFSSAIFRYISYVFFMGYYFITLISARAMIPYQCSLKFFDSKISNVFFIYILVTFITFFLVFLEKDEIKSQSNENKIKIQFEN